MEVSNPHLSPEKFCTYGNTVEMSLYQEFPLVPRVPCDPWEWELLL